MPRRDQLCSALPRKPVRGVLPERLEHPKARRVGSVRDDHRLVNERGEYLGDVFIGGDTGDHPWYRLELEPAVKHGELFEREPLRFTEGLVAPIERGAHRAMSPISPAAVRRHQIRSLVELADEFGEPDCSHTCRRQFDGEGDAVEMSRDRRQRRDVVSRE